MLCDLHAHYPMHLVPARPPARAVLEPGDGRSAWLERLDAHVLAGASRLWNHRSFGSGPAVTVPAMRAGGVGVALSVLILPLVEMGNRLTVRYRRKDPYGAPPADRYFPALIRQLELVERSVGEDHRASAGVARSPQELDAVLASGRLALVHCLEGGFHLGSTPEAVERSVVDLAGRGVAYITLAHLYWRHVATNVPAIPWFSDRLYERLFPQPQLGLSELGRAAIRAMVRERVLIDVTHMSARALEDTFELLDALDPGHEVPLVATHVGYRFGDSAYNLDQPVIERIARRGGVIGLIVSERYAADGVRSGRTGSFEESFAVLARHIDRIHEITGSHRHTAIGSDLDGFIKPTLAGLDDPSRLSRLESALHERYGADADLIASGNVLRLLRAYWRGVPS